MLGLAARRGRQQCPLARALIAHGVPGATQIWTGNDHRPPSTSGAIHTGTFLQDGALCNKAFPSIPSRAVRQASTSAGTWDKQRPRVDSHDDVDQFMKSRYDQPSVTESDEEVEMLWRLKLNKAGKFDNVLAVLGDPQLLAAAHERLNERRRNWTLASNELEISHVPTESAMSRSRDIDWNWFKEAAHSLRTGVYAFKPLQRLDIARRGRGESRQYAFVRPKDQVIQEAIRDVLERIYEPQFVAAQGSGFRPGANVHSALKAVKYGWKGVSWFLQFDVRITDHPAVQKRLLSILREQIEDEAFLDLLRQMFKLGTIWIDTASDEDMPEGSVLSPLLGNIYFHQLDLEINRIQEDIGCASQTSF